MSTSSKYLSTPLTSCSLCPLLDLIRLWTFGLKVHSFIRIVSSCCRCTSIFCFLFRIQCAYILWNFITAAQEIIFYMKYSYNLKHLLWAYLLLFIFGENVQCFSSSIFLLSKYKKEEHLFTMRWTTGFHAALALFTLSGFVLWVRPFCSHSTRSVHKVMLWTSAATCWNSRSGWQVIVDFKLYHLPIGVGCLPTRIYFKISSPMAILAAKKWKTVIYPHLEYQKLSSLFLCLIASLIFLAFV